MRNARPPRSHLRFPALARASRAAILGLLAFTAACDRRAESASALPPASAPASSPAPALSPTAAPSQVILAGVAPSFPRGEHPYADMAHVVGTVLSVPVRGRVVVEQGQPDLRASTPAGDFSQKEIPSASIEAVLLKPDGAEIQSLGRGQCDGEGYVSVAFPLKEGAVPQGRYLVDIRVNGAFAGRTTALLLAADHAGPVVRSDIDLTYLDTHFTRKRDLVGLITQSAPERKTLPAMEKVYAALRAGASGKDDRPLVFISGSPRFFKRVLEARMDLDGVQQDGVFLKAMDDIAASKALLLQVDRIVPSLKEQVGYKLGHLLRGRMELPSKAEEILMGDDSEADFVVYSIYHRIMSGELDQDGIKKELARAGVDAGSHAEIAALAAKARASVSLAGASPVKAIYINLTGSPNATLKVSDWPVPGKARLHVGAWPLILDLYEEGLVSRESVAAVKARLQELGQAENDRESAAKAGVASGFLKPESLTLPN